MRFFKTTLLAAALAMGGTTAAYADPTDFSFLLVNDIYEMDGKTRGGFGRVNGLAKKEKAANPNMMFVHAGDTISPSLLSGFDKGAHIIELINLGPLDIFVPGNHEYDFGKDVFFQRMGELKAPILAANLRMPDGSKVAGIDDTMMKTFGDPSDPMKHVKVGIIGLTAEDSDVKSNPEDLKISPSLATGVEQAKMLREAGADIITVIVHGSRSVDRALYDSKAFDIILTGDDHDLMVFHDGSKVMVESGEDGEYLTAIDIDVTVGESRGKRRVRWHPNFRIMDTAGAEKDAATMERVAAFEATLSKELDVAVGTTNSELSSKKSDVRGGETALGNLIADAMKNAVGADIAITNGGGIRGNTTYAPGTELTRRDILTELPFGNKTLLLEVSGDQVKQALENGVSQVEESAGRFPHVSGMTVTYDLSKPAGSRIASVMVNGAELNMAAKYKLATNDYMAGGGDGYDALRGSTVLLGDLDGKLMANDVMAYIRDKGAVDAKVDGRMMKK